VAAAIAQPKIVAIRNDDNCLSLQFGAAQCIDRIDDGSVSDVVPTGRTRASAASATAADFDQSRTPNR